MVKQKDIAKACGVSVATVSVALNHPHKVSKELRDKISMAIKNLGYKQPESNIKKIGLVFDNFKNYYYGDFYNEVIFGILNCAEKKDVFIKIYNDFDKDYFDVHDLNGIIFVGRTKNEDIAKAVKHKIPYVIAGHPNTDYLDSPCVYYQRKKSILQAIDYLKSCGHQNIALLCGEPLEDDIIGKEFINNYKDNVDNEFIYYANIHEIYSVEIAWNKILSNKEKITSVICFTDLMAYHIYKCAQKYNISIPEDISVIGHDGLTIPHYVPTNFPELTSFYSDKEKIGTKSYDLLSDIITGNINNDYIVKLESTFSPGNSVKRI